MNRSGNKSHRLRMRAERRFRWYGQATLGIALFILLILGGSIFSRGIPGFFQAQAQLAITFDAKTLEMGQGVSPQFLSPYSCQRLTHAALQSLFPNVTGRRDVHALHALISGGAGDKIKAMLVKNPSLLSHTENIWLPLSGNADLYVKGVIREDTPEAARPLTNQQIGWLKTLQAKGAIRTAFNASFLTQGDSRLPEEAGFLGAMIGSALTLAICLLVAFPLGVMTAVYLEEFARKGKWVDIIEVNINNLAAVPSIVFGLLGLAVYINFFGMPRSAPLVGGLTLALMILPVIIIAARASLQAVPGSIRDAARGLGASPLQVVWHHALPLSMPGILTGTILGLARAIGETAPLLMIGMVAFVADIPTGFTSPATAMPVQIYLWASSPETAFAEKTAAGILVLLMLLLLMNALAIFLRRRFEVRW